MFIVLKNNGGNGSQCTTLSKRAGADGEEFAFVRSEGGLASGTTCAQNLQRQGMVGSGDLRYGLGTIAGALDSEEQHYRYVWRM